MLNRRSRKRFTGSNPVLPARLSKNVNNMAIEHEFALNRCESEIWNIDEAIENLREVREMEDVIASLEYRRDALQEEAEGYRKAIDKEWESDMRALNRECERNLL